MVKLLGHHLHPMLIVFPLGLLSTAAVFDILYLATDNATWSEVSFWLISAGIIGGLVAALPGFIDWLSVPSGTRAKAIGATHGLGNLLMVGLFAASWFMRFNGVRTAPETMAFVLSFGAVVIAMFTAWLGGELVERLGVGVDAGANADAPSSLSGRPATNIEAPEERPRRAA